jgi:hypothetical protein
MKRKQLGAEALEEFGKYFDLKFPGWRSDERVARKVRQTARTAAKNEARAAAQREKESA